MNFLLPFLIILINVLWSVFMWKSILYDLQKKLGNILLRISDYYRNFLQMIYLILHQFITSHKKCSKYSMKINKHPYFNNYFDQLHSIHNYNTRHFNNFITLLYIISRRLFFITESNYKLHSNIKNIPSIS